MYTLKQGVLISIEGIDGSGKSTLAEHLASIFMQQHIPVVSTKEPGKTDLGKLIRPIVQEKKVAVGSLAEFFLFAADRAQHFDEVVIPALAAGKLVISDRMADSSLVYQGYGKGIDVALIQTVNAWAMRSIQPTLVIYVKIDPLLARKRLIARNQELTSFEKNEHYQETLAAAFDTVLSEKNNVLIVNGAVDQQTLADTTSKAILERLSSQGLIHYASDDISRRNTNQQFF